MTSGARIKALVKKLIQVQKELQMELKKKEEFLNEKGIGNYLNYDPNILEALVMITPQLANNPELSDYSIYSINDSDFGIGDLTLDKDEIEESKQT